MANPKKRVSSARRDKRRSHDSLQLPTIAMCSNCGSAKLLHRVCPECGYYRGRQAIDKGELV